MFEILIGLISGIISGTGMGGGTILILCLTLFLGYYQKNAQAINLIFFIPTSIATIWINIKEKNIDFKIAKTIIIFGIIGATIGGIIAQKINTKNLKKIFGIFLIVISIHEVYVIFKEYKKLKKEDNKNKTN